MFGGDQSREHVQAADFDDVIVSAAAIFHTAEFYDVNLSALGAVRSPKFFKQDHAVNDTLHVDVTGFRREIVEKKNRGAATDENIL